MLISYPPRTFQFTASTWQSSATVITTHFTHAHIYTIISSCTHVYGVHATSVSKQIFFSFHYLVSHKGPSSFVSCHMWVLWWCMCYIAEQQHRGIGIYWDEFRTAPLSHHRTKGISQSDWRLFFHYRRNHVYRNHAHFVCDAIKKGFQLRLIWVIICELVCVEKG